MTDTIPTARPHVAILGAGPVGLDAALAAVDAGLSFTLYEAGSSVGRNVADWGHVRLFTPWSLNVSPRMRRHLAAAGRGPGVDPEACPTGSEFVDRLLEPVAGLPAVSSRIELGARVVAVGRKGLLKHESIGGGEREQRPFRLLVERSASRVIESADTVLDCTGTWGHPNAVGDGGIPAPGEEDLDGSLIRRIPDLPAEGELWEGSTLLVGAGHSAQTAACALAALAGERPGTRIVWALRDEDPAWTIDGDPLSGRLELSRRAEALARGESPAVEVRRGVAIESFARRGDRIEVTLRHADETTETVSVDRVLALTGNVGDHTLYRELQIHECYATSGPMKLSAALLGASSADCLDQESHGVDTLRNPEPRFFILGSKSYGRNNTFLMRVGWDQVDEVFGALA